MPLPGDANPPGRPRSTFRSLRHRNYRLYFLGQLVSLVGSWMQTTALMWLAFDLTHQSRWPALISAAQMLPTFFLGSLGGVVVDRLTKRSVLIATQVALAIQALVLAGLCFAGWETPWALVGVTLLSGVVQAIDLPARLAFVVDLVGREDLANAVALNAMVFNVARLIGPALAGSLLLWLEPSWCFLLNGLSYVAVIAALWAMTVRGEAGTPSGEAGLRRIVSGFTYLSRKPKLAGLLFLVGGIAVCGWPFMTLLPALVKTRLSGTAHAYSFLLSSTGLGALTAALGVATFVTRARQRPFIAAGVGVLTVGLAGLSFAGSLAMAAICCAAIGCGLILFLSTSQGVLQLGADDAYRGRVMGIWAMILSGSVPLGNLLAGFAADHWGTDAVLRGQGLGCIAAALAVGGLFWLGERRVTALASGAAKAT